MTSLRILLSTLAVGFAAEIGLGGAVGPAHADETRFSTGDVTVEPGIHLTTVVSGLEHPWGMAFLPDGDLLITERAGRLRLVRDGILVVPPVAGVPDVFASGQGGLLDIALDPDFADTRLVYLAYAHGNEEANRLRVARATFDGMALNDLDIIFEVADTKAGTQHFGARLLWLPDGTLLISVGDGGNPPVSFAGADIRLQAQNPGTHFGSVVRINADGSLPADNPLLGQDGALPEMWTIGNRNIQGLALDPETGAVWANEHGARRGDEINRLEPGRNYGWPAATYSRNYGLFATEISPHTSLPDMTGPVFAWVDSTHAPSGLAVYRGNVFPEWNGDLLSGGLVTEDVRRITLDEAGVVQAETSIAIGERVRDVRVGPDGHVYVLTDERRGQLIRLDRGQ